jgi:hypothetical protein
VSIIPNYGRDRSASKLTRLRLFPVPGYQAVPPTAHQHQGPPTHKHVRTRVTFHPFKTISYRKQPRPAATFDADVAQVQARCTAGGGDPAAIGLLANIFVEGISQKALMRKMMSSEASDHHDGRAGQVYRTLLRVDESKRFHCRLCAVKADEGGWKHARDVLRHLKRDHFGLGDTCERW